MQAVRQPKPRSTRNFGPAIGWTLALVGIGLLLYLILSAKAGVPDPTTTEGLSRGSVVLNSGLLVMREGLEAVLVLAAITASFLGANRHKRRPVAIGAGVACGFSAITWFIAIFVIGAVGGPSLYIHAATGLVAVVVLLVVMNWFFHRMYWTGWIAHHHRRRRALLGGRGGKGLTFGLMALGFTAVYREGFEIVLFLQNLRLKHGDAVVLEGVGLGLAFTAVIGVLTFLAHRKLPYKRMLVITGATIGFVLIVMVGESAQELQLAGWIPTTNIGIVFPEWVGTWLAIFPTVETLAAQSVAATAIVGSYLVAEYIRVRRPAKKGLKPALRMEQPPVASAAQENPPATAVRA